MVIKIFLYNKKIKQNVAGVSCHQRTVRKVVSISNVEKSHAVAWLFIGADDETADKRRFFMSGSIQI